jgi:hypothetical protein
VDFPKKQDIFAKDAAIAKNGKNDIPHFCTVLSFALKMTKIPSYISEFWLRFAFIDPG